jgi:ABC-type phosphate/phosphonate transport system permease subunit
MSLKGFHIVFVSVSMLLFAFLVLWGFVLTPEKTTLATAIGVTGIVGALLMPVYGVYFLRKARRIHL